MWARLIPAIEWAGRYRRGDLGPDLMAGLTVGVMLVPQSMAYAMLAGLPPAVGLYAATFPLIAYALYGSSRHLAVGPVAMVSLLVFSGLSPLAQQGSDEYLALAVLLALLVGVVQLAFGLLRMGFLANFMSHAVVSGFSSAAAIVICLSQVKHLAGVKMEGGESAIALFGGLMSHLHEVRPVTLLLGSLAIGVLALLKRKAPRIPAPMVVVAGGVLAVYLLRLHDLGVDIVGDVPRGLPPLRAPVSEWSNLGRLLPTALTIVFVGYMESIAVANLIAARERYRVQPDRELVGLGLANIVAAFLAGYPVTGGFSRTAINYQAGARTPLASVITAVLVMLSLALLTPLFYYLPKAILAAIVIVAVAGLVDYKEARHLFRVKAQDGWILLLTFLATLAFGAEKGVIAGVVLSLLLFIWRSAHPSTEELGYVAEDDAFRDVSRCPDARRRDDTIIYRVDASLYFANMGFVEDHIRQALGARPDVRWVILDLSGVNDIDGVSVGNLEEILDNFSHVGVQFEFAGAKAPVREVLARAGWEETHPALAGYESLEHVLDRLGLDYRGDEPHGP